MPATNPPTNVPATTIDQDGLTQAEDAVQAKLDTMTVTELGMSFNVGSKVTVSQVSEVTETAIQAYLNFINSPKI